MNVETFKRELSRCVRCGACKAVCPTYLKLRDESMSPRGRLALIGAVENIELNPTKLLSHKLYSCILCGACSTSCSPKIPIYELLRYSRKIMAEKTFRVSIIEKFTKLMPAVTDIPLTQKIAKRDVIKRIEKQKLFFKNREKIGSVLVFMGCLVNYVYPHMALSLIEVLNKLGYEVDILNDEPCCGSPLLSMGFDEEALSYAKKNIDLLNEKQKEYIITICPTCCVTLKRHYKELTGVSLEHVMDINEFLYNKDINTPLPFNKKVIYHDPCHLKYILGIKSEPRHIIENIKGIEMVEINEEHSCCGFGGVFHLTNRELSERISLEKIETFKNSGAQEVITSCPGCVMQLKKAAEMRGINMNIRHIVELIDILGGCK